MSITLCIQTKWTKQLFTNNWFEHDSGRNNWIYNNKSKVFTKYNRPSLNNLSAIAKLNTGRLVHWFLVGSCRCWRPCRTLLQHPIRNHVKPKGEQSKCRGHVNLYYIFIFISHFPNQSCLGMTSGGTLEKIINI